MPHFRLNSPIEPIPPNCHAAGDVKLKISLIPSIIVSRIFFIYSTSIDHPLLTQNTIANMGYADIDKLAINTIRVLAVCLPLFPPQITPPSFSTA
jgi:hypothetical protein